MEAFLANGLDSKEEISKYLGNCAWHSPEELQEQGARAPMTPPRKKNRSDQQTAAAAGAGTEHQDEEPPWRKNRGATTSKNLGPAIAAAEPPPPAAAATGGGPTHVQSQAASWIAPSPAKSIHVLPKTEPTQPPMAQRAMVGPSQYVPPPWRSGVANLPPPPKGATHQPGPEGWYDKRGQPWRPGKGGGQPRYGFAGGKNRDWHRQAHRAKNMGAEAYAKFKEENPHPLELRKAWEWMKWAYPKQ